MTAAPSKTHDSLFREHERFLWGLSFRMTGCAADADDIVQETFARALASPPARTDEPWRPWLARVALNLARDTLRRRKRDGYVGPWLPSPVPANEIGDEGTSPDARYERAESVSFAFLLALESLSPRERAVLLLRDVFDYSVREAADLLHVTETNAKVLHHRARKALVPYDETREARAARAGLSAEALRKFLVALATRDGAALEATLAESARAMTDGGGEFFAARNVVRGRANVAKLFLGISRRYADIRTTFAEYGGLPSIVTDLPTRTAREAPRTVIACEVDDAGLITAVYTVSASRKLTRVTT